MAIEKSRFGNPRTFMGAVLSFAAAAFGTYAVLPDFGEPPRLEQEFKITVSGALSDEAKKALYDVVSEELGKREWANSKYVPGPYYMGSDLDVLYFEDTYYDDASGSLERSGISHRLRYRWKSPDDYAQYRSKGIVPQRLELQTKDYGPGSMADAEGYKKALKNRYEIKNDFRLNPLTSWLLRRENGDAFVSWLAFAPFGDRFTPVRLAEDAAVRNGIPEFRYSDLRPAARLVAKRTRFHVNKKTPFWYGDNPDNVFLITVDEVDVLDPGSGKHVAKFSEIEVDFERNTFYKLFDSVYKAGNSRDAAVLASFEADQKAVRQLVVEKLAALGHPPEDPSGTASKFMKAFRAIRSADR